MANVSAYLAKLALDFSLNAETATRPTAWGIGLSLGSPTNVSASEIGAGSGYTRQPGTFSPAASPAGTTKNSGPATFGPFASAASISGIVIMDGTDGTNMLWYGLLATPRTVGADDRLVLSIDALTVSLS